jgi:hypothetical protein
MHQARKKLVKVLQSILDGKRVKAKSNQHEGKKDLMDLLMEAEDEDGQKLEYTYQNILKPSKRPRYIYLCCIETKHPGFKSPIFIMHVDAD